MNKMLAGFGLTVVGLLGLGGPADASAYPPKGVGSVSIDKPVCNYADADSSRLESWSVTVNYSVTAADAWILVVNPHVDDVLVSRDVPIGSGSLTITSDTPGVGGSNPLYGNFDVTLGAGDDVVQAQSVGCPIADVYRPDAKPKSGTSTKPSGSERVLPETGLDATELGVLAAALTASGVTLVWASRRRGPMSF